MVTRRYQDSGETYTAKDLGAVAVNLGGAAIRPFFAVDLLFDTPQYYWTGLGDLTVAGVTYGGAGNLLNISALPETSEIKAANATISLSGINGALLSTALQTQYHGRLARVKFGLGDPVTLVEIFVGYMDQMTIDEAPDSCTISLSLESRLVDLERPRPVRLTTESQRLRFPNKTADRAFEFINDLQTKPLMWGRGVRMSANGGGLF
jgi:hypothetical protein